MSQFYDDFENEDIKERQRRIILRISEMVKLGWEKSGRIRKICADRKLDHTALKSLSDFNEFPVISREQLIELESEEPPYGGLNNEDWEIDRIFISPGPVYEPHLSEEDPLWARAYFAAGIGKKDIVLNAFSYHMVAAGLTFHGGLRRVGATVVPSGTSSSQIQVQLIRDLGITAYTGTPSFLMSIINKAKEMGYDFKRDFILKRACFAAEPLDTSLREIFEKTYGIDTYQMYGATEVGDIAFECSEKKGWHICEEVLVEIVDPHTGKSVPPGMYGEVVVTRLNSIFFLFRFGTGDLSRMSVEICPCGRTSYRLDGIVGRVGDAVKVRGLFITPKQVRTVQEKYGGLKLRAVISRVAHEDILTLEAEPTAAQGNHADLEMKVKSDFKDICTVKIDRFVFVKTGTINNSESVIVDNRKWT